MQASPRHCEQVSEMRTVFFSRNFPKSCDQKRLVSATEAWFSDHGIVCQSASTFDQLRPALVQVKEAIAISQAVLVMAFQREEDEPIGKSYLQSSPWVHMEAAMAFQAGKHLHLFQQNSLSSLGIFDTASTATPVTYFDIAISDTDLRAMLDTTFFPPRTLEK